MSLTWRSYVGAEIAEVVDALAALRITVFRDWPYLYDGDFEYERRYLADYAGGDTILVAVFDGDEMLGASTGMPLFDHAEASATTFPTFVQDMNSIFYCAESVLLSSHRGQGIYHQFFDRREAHSRRLGFTFSTFCAVQRPGDHPSRPPEAQSLDPVWRRFGYPPLPDVVTQFRWRDIGEAEETDKAMQFWGKAL